MVQTAPPPVFRVSTPAPTPGVRLADLTRRAESFAAFVISQECERVGTQPGARLGEMTNAVMFAVGAFLAVRTNRFPRLAASLLARFTADRLPGATVRALRVAAVASFAATCRRPGLAATVAKCVKPRPASVRIGPTRGRVVISRYALFIPADGLCRRRTTAQAVAAGFPNVAAFQDALATNPPPSKALYRQAVAVVARGALQNVQPAEVEAVAVAAKLAAGPGAMLNLKTLAATVRRELSVTAEAAVGEFMAVRLSRFPRLTSALLARFGAGCVPLRTRGAIRSATCRAVRVRLRRLKHCPFPALACPVPMTLAEVDDMLARVRAVRPWSAYSERCARAHAALLEQARAA